MAVNWPRLMRRASFKGVPFQVETYSASDSGRHGVNHDYVGGEQGKAEDLGFKTGAHRLTAYVASDSAYTAGDALVAACTSAGPGSLILPTGKLINCLCVEIGRTEERDKLGYVAFEIEFMPWGGQLGPFGVDLFDRVCASALALLPAALSGGLSALVGMGLAQIALAATGAVAAGKVIQSSLTSAPVDSAVAAPIAAALAGLVSSAPSFAGVEDVGSWAQSAAEQIQAIGSALSGPDAVSYATSLCASLGALAPSSATPGLIAQGAAASALIAALQGAAAGEAARGAAALPLTDRASAKAALDALTALTDPLADALGAALGADAAQPLSDALLAAARQLSAAMLDTAPLIEVETTLSYPASVVAFMLYGDPSRADELLARNEVGTPLFMPNRFEALAE